MKLLRTLTLLLTGLLFSLSASAQKTTEPVAYRLVDSVGRPVTFDKLITRAAGADVVFFGELHNNPISHWMQLRVLEALQQRKGKNLTLGLEMLEADIQLILDEYLAKTISPKSYGDEARLWPNYETDYEPHRLLCQGPWSQSHRDERTPSLCRPGESQGASSPRLA